MLQNRRGLDLLTAEKGGLCLFLDESCWFYANQSGVVQEAANPYRSSLSNPPEIKPLPAVIVDGWNWMPWVLPLLKSFIFIILLFTFGHCWFNLFQGFLQDRIRAISQHQVKTVLLLEILAARIENQHYRPQTSFLPDHKPLNHHLSVQKSPEY